jgi:RNA polymerase sigma-70 factor
MSVAQCLEMQPSISGRVLERTRQRWPQMTISTSQLTEQIERMRVMPDNLRRYGDELCLALACAERAPVALGILEAEFMRPAERAIRRLRCSSDFSADALQTLRERLLLGNTPRIGRYAAAGPLAGWLRRAAVNVALNLIDHENRERSRAVSSATPRSCDQQLNEIHAAIAQQCLDEALARLTAEQRCVLRWHAEGAGIDQLSSLSGSHRSTMARALTTIRNRLAHEVVTQFGVTLELTSSEASAALAAVHFELDLCGSLVSEKFSATSLPAKLIAKRQVETAPFAG